MAAALDVELPWSRIDIEQRLGFRGARFTRVNLVLSGLISVVLTAMFYGVMLLADGRPGFLGEIARSFLHNQQIPFFTAWLSFWALTMLLIKYLKLRVQRRALAYSVTPDHADFVLSSANVDVVLSNIYATVDDPRHFVLFNRIVIALSNLRNLGRVADVDEILRSQAEQDEASMETSYVMLQAFVWAIPILGFIGTALGLSSAVGNFGAVIHNATDSSGLASELTKVTAGLATAFETTLQALVAALVIQLLLSLLKKSEEEYLDACAEYCVRNVVGKLRIMPLEHELV